MCLTLGADEDYKECVYDYGFFCRSRAHDLTSGLIVSRHMELESVAK